MSSFRYKKIGLNPVTGSIYRPIIPIEMHKKRFSFPTEALLDTGADFCIFSGEIGRVIGLDIKSGAPHKVTGLGGTSTNGFIHKIGLTITGLTTYSTWGFFSDELNEMNHAILGQQGFFENFKVSFEYRKKLIVIRQK